MRRTSSSTFSRHPLLHALLALTSLLIHLSTASSDLELIGPVTTKSIDMTLVGVDDSERYKVWQTTTADFIMDYFKDSENVFEVEVEVAMLYETITEIPVGTYTGNAGVPGSEWTLGGSRRLAQSVRITYNQITSYKSDDPTIYDETYIAEEPFRGDPQGYIAKLKSSSEKGHYDEVIEVGVGIPPPTPPPTPKPKFVFPPTPKKKSSGGDSMLYIIIGVACGGVLIIALAGGLIIRRRRRKSRGLGFAPQNIMVGNTPQNPPHSIFTRSTPQTMSTGVESGNNSWQSGNMNNMQAVTGVAAAPPIMMMQDREEVLPSGEVRIHIIAPKGKLGITIENLPWGGPSYVAKVSGKSPLFGRVQIGDKVMTIDGNDVQQVSAKDITKLLAQKKKNPQRQITIMRGESKGNNHQLQHSNSVPSGMNNMGNDPYSRQGSQMDVLPNHSNDSLFRSMNNMGNDPYGGMGREGSQRDQRDDRNFQHNHSSSMNNMGMGNDPYGMGRDGSFRDDRHFQPNHAFSRSMNNMENDPYGMGREGSRRDDRHFQRRHSVSRMNNMDNGPYGMGREGSHRDDRDFHLNQSAHGIRGEASWRDDRRRTISEVENVHYGIRREGSQREVREVDFNHSVPSGMTMDSDPYEIRRDRGQRLDRGSHFNYNPTTLSKEKQRRISAPSSINIDSDLIDPYSHEGNNHLIVEPATQYANSKSKYTTVTAIAPRGKLGVVLEDGSDGGPSFVSEIREDSVLKGEILLFDRIASIDGQDVKELKAFHISKLLAHKSRNYERKIVFLREKNEGGQNKFMV